MKIKLILTAWLVISTAVPVPTVLAFCGFYVAKADTKLYNKASQVVLARYDDKTVITMSNDFKGDLKAFAIVIPVPTVLEREQIHAGDQALIDHLDAYSSPRLVEYFDSDPCLTYPRSEAGGFLFKSRAAQDAVMEQAAKRLGVTIEATYTVGEYDILILSATQSDGLERWLRDNGYRVPPGASRVLNSYLKQGMKFFVAKVNLEEQLKLGFNHLRPIQIAFESPKFILPIRLGMVNADGAQELFIYTLTRKGRVETTNYRTVKLPTGQGIPTHIKEEFGAFYKAMFEHQAEKEHDRVLFTEYAWDMNWCDPCATDPLSQDELRRLGVFWLDGASNGRSGPQQVFLTRLHVRYDAQHFPEDLVFQETADRQNFQARYVLRHPWKDSGNCSEAQTIAYRKQLRERQEQEAQTLASLTGWDIGAIRKKIDFVPAAITPKKWYQKIWE